MRQPRSEIHVRKAPVAAHVACRCVRDDAPFGEQKGPRAEGLDGRDLVLDEQDCRIGAKCTTDECHHLIGLSL